MTVVELQKKVKDVVMLQEYTVVSKVISVANSYYTY